MFKTLRVSLCLGLGLWLSPPALAGDSPFTRPMTNDSASGGMRFSSGGEVHIAAMIVNVDGRVAVCGFWKEANRVSSASKSLSMMKKGMAVGVIQHGNRTLLRGLTFMNQVSEKDYVVGTRANCKLTRKSWQPSYSNKKLKVRIPRFRSVG